MTTINLIEIELPADVSQECYRAADDESEILMQHCVGAELIELNAHGLDKLKIIANAHNWLVEIEYM